MIETEAYVISVADGMAWVETRPHQACPNCDPVHGCRSLSIARVFALKPQQYQVLDPLHSQPGDQVVVAVAEQALTRSALLGYVVPLLALFFGAMLGALMSELVSVVAAVVAFLGSLLMIRQYAAKYRGNAVFQPVIVRRLPQQRRCVEKPCQLKKNSANS